MNYLGHAYLSFGRPSVLVGNMISDFVKGAARFGYPALVQQGIMLHRHIDSYTDGHPAIRKAAAVFRPAYRLYSGAVVDVVLDHFLAADPERFPKTALARFSQEVYRTLEEQAALLPAGFAVLFPYMKTHDWLYNYRHEAGLERSLAGLVRRAQYLTDHKPALAIFRAEYRFLQECYRRFIGDVKSSAEAWLAQPFG